MVYYTKLERARYLGLKKGILVGYDIILKKIDKIQKRTRLVFRPTSIQVEPTTKCNLRCEFCESSIWDRKGMDMSFSDFKEIIDQFPYLVELLLQGIGEPLMCKDFFKMVEYCKKKKIIVETVTNATLMDKANVKKLVDSRIDTVMISLDGATPKTFEKTRTGADFEKVIENTKNLVAIRGNLKKPRIVFHFTGTKHNIHELPDVLKLAKKIGIDDVEAQDIHFWGDEKLKNKINRETLRQEIEKSRKIIDQTKQLSKEIGMPFDFLGSGSLKSLYSNMDSQLQADQRLCQKVFKSCFVTVDGYVTTCACVPDPRTINFGNLLKEDFDTIWNNSKYIKMREARQKGKMPEFCRLCTVPHTYR